MFNQLIASRPVGARTDSRGLALSLLLHGSVIAAMVLATTQVERFVEPGETIEPPIYLPPPPEPAPRAPAPARAVPATPAEPVPAPVPMAPPITLSADIPTAIPEPSPFVPAPIFTGGGMAGGASRDVGPGVPAVPDGGVFEGEQVDVPAELLKRSPLPKYPDGLRNLAIEGGARVRFVVDTLGRVELGSYEVLESTHPAFASAVRASLPRMRFKAARIGARPVRQLVEFPITFRLDGRP